MTFESRRVQIAARVVRTFVMVAIASLFIVPYIYSVTMSFTEERNAFSYPIQWIPDPVDPENYGEVWQSRFPFYIAFINSLLVAAGSALGALFTSSMAGFAFARLRFPGRDTVFLLYLSTMMIPPQVVLIPRFMMFNSLGFLNTLWTIILPSSFTIFGTFLLRQFYKQIPKELQEAAIVDGAKFGTVWWRVLQPLAKPAMLSLLILMVTWKWNEYLQPLVFLSSPDKFTIPLALDYFVEENVTEVTLIMAGAVLSSIPLIAVFVFAQKYFIRGVIMSGIKG